MLVLPLIDFPPACAERLSLFVWIDGEPQCAVCCVQCATYALVWTLQNHRECTVVCKCAQYRTKKTVLLGRVAVVVCIAVFFVSMLQLPELPKFVSNQRSRRWCGASNAKDRQRMQPPSSPSTTASNFDGKCICGVHFKDCNSQNIPKIFLHVTRLRNCL